MAMGLPPEHVGVALQPREKKVGNKSYQTSSED